MANYLDEDGWNYINGISHGCTKLVDAITVVEHKGLNYLILWACNYYVIADKEKWTSPLLEALRETRAIPPMTPGVTIKPAGQDMISNYVAIDTLSSIGITKVENLQGAWQEAVNETNKPGDSDMKTTMEMLRTDVTFKRSRL